MSNNFTNNEEYFEAEILSVDDNLLLKAVSGSLSGENFEVSGKTITSSQRNQFNTGDRVMVLSAPNPLGNQYTIVDFVRKDSIALLFFLFVFIALAVGKKWGLASIVGMIYSFLVIFLFLLPRVIAGGEPVFNAIVTAALIVPVTFYLSHGINQKTNIAIVATIATLIFTAVLAAIFIEATHLTGFAQEEALFLQGYASFNMKGILLAGIIIGVLGILDDITVSQASVVQELRQISPKASPIEIYKRAMNVGRDHIASLINTLVLVYTGASMPLLLLFSESKRGFWEVLNLEIVADEIVRTLVGSIGLILAVPLSTFMAAFIVKK